MSASRHHIVAGLLFAFFGVLVPLLNYLGLVADTTLNLWGRYFCFAIVALGMDLIWGFTGILSLCQAFFFCLGGYAIGMHMLLKTGTKGVYGSTLPDFMVWNRVEELPLFWEPFHSLPLTLLLGLLVPGLAALTFGFLAFRSRIKGVYLAIITQALALAMWLLFLRNETMLGGTNGLTDFKTLLGFELAEPATKRGLYVVACAALVGAYYLCRYIVGSKLGKLLVAIRDSEHRLRFIGYHITRYKLFVFVVASALAGLGGMLYVPQTGIITPGRMDVQASIEIVVWTAVGGRGTLVGAIVGAVLVNLLYSFLTGAFPGTWLYFLGALFVGVVLFFPEGVAGIVGRLRRA
ncbi:MAG: urea ABC transporter permease subunit UrtC [Gemmatimonadota bacterium]|nr:urea ABC transporter permease subunit UrtC [Gemmatimonadota bacterium]